MPKTYLTTREAAEEIGVHQATILRMAKRHVFPTLKPSPRTTRIPIASWEEFKLTYTRNAHTRKRR